MLRNSVKNLPYATLDQIARRVGADLSGGSNADESAPGGGNHPNVGSANAFAVFQNLLKADFAWTL